MRTLLLALLTLSVVTACSSGSDNNNNTETVRGLNLPKSINVAAPSDNVIPQTAPLMLGKIGIASATDPGTDYSSDSVQYYSGNNQLFNLDFANSLLCFLDNIRATEMVNKGAYIARLSDNLCSDSNDAVNDSTSTVKYDDLTILSQRQDNQSPHYIQIWFTEDLDLGIANAGHFFVEIIIYQGVSDINPFGSFEFNYKVSVDAGDFGGVAGESTTFLLANFRSYLNSQNKPQFDFAYLGGNAINDAITNYDFLETNVIEFHDETATSGRAKNYYNWSNNVFESSIGVDFNSNYVLTAELASNTVTQQCLSLTDTYSTVYQYNLYHAVDGSFRSKPVQAGQRTELKTHVFFQYNGNFGSIGNWGYWVDSDEPIPDQAAVVGFEDGENYTVYISPGELLYFDVDQYFSVDTVTPSDSDFFSASNEVTLYCYSNCPMGGVTQEAINAASGVGDLYHNGGAFSATPYTYTALSENHKVILKDNTNNNAAVDFTQVDFSGNVNLLTTSYIGSGSLTREPTSATTSFNWYSGPLSYYQQATLVDSNGEEVVLDRTLDVDYVHDAANDRYNTSPETNPTHDQQFTLYYGGEGNLYGFPWYDNAQGISVPASLKDGTVLENTEGTFLVKATGIETRSIEKDLSECAGLDAEAVLNDTNLNFLAKEDMHDVSISAENMPIVSAPPKVIDGEIQ